MSRKHTIARLQALAGSWRGSQAMVSVARSDALALGLAIEPEAPLVVVPASELCRAVDAVAIAATAEALSETLGDEPPADPAPADVTPGDESSGDADGEKPPKKARKR